MGDDGEERRVKREEEFENPSVFLSATKSGKKIFISFDLVRRSLPSQARCASSPRGRAKGLVQGFDNCVIVNNGQSRTPVPTGRGMNMP